MDKTLIFNEITNHLLNDEKPSVYLNKISKDKKYNIDPINNIFKLGKIDQNPKYHPEGNVFNHVLMVVDRASKLKDKSEDEVSFMWSALLHDIGKLTTTRVRKGRITSYDHDIEGEKISKEILDKLTDNESLKYKVGKLVRYHMQPLFFDKNLPFFKCDEMLSEIDYKEVALLSSCDRLGRGNMTEAEENEQLRKIENFKEYCEIRRKEK
ncbi:MAG: HD domain-containing protein [Paraclostridium sp.]